VPRRRPRPGRRITPEFPLKICVLDRFWPSATLWVIHIVGVPRMTGPGDDRAVAAAGHGHLRAGHADRDQTVNVLKAAFVQGRLAQDELELRLHQALTARTYADLRAVTADLPAGLVTVIPPGRAPDLDRRAGVRVIAALTAMCTILWLAAAQRHTGGSDFFTGSLFYVLVVLTVLPGMPAALLLLHSRLEKRASRQSLPGGPPGGGGRPTQRTGPGQRGPNHQLKGPRNTAYLSAAYQPALAR
jgi:hypothetical protein